MKSHSRLLIFVYWRGNGICTEHLKVVGGFNILGKHMADRSARFQQKNFPYGDRSANPGLASRLRPAIASNRICGSGPPGAHWVFRNCADCTKGRHFICENCIVDFLVKFRHNRPLSAGANGHGKSPHYRRLSQFFIIAFL